MGSTNASRWVMILHDLGAGDAMVSVLVSFLSVACSFACS